MKVLVIGGSGLQVHALHESHAFDDANVTRFHLLQGAPTVRHLLQVNASAHARLPRVPRCGQLRSAGR
jgi:hypothetical protein